MLPMLHNILFFAKVGKPTGNFMACVVIPVDQVTAEVIPDIANKTREIILPTGR